MRRLAAIAAHLQPQNASGASEDGDRRRALLLQLRGRGSSSSSSTSTSTSGCSGEVGGPPPATAILPRVLLIGDSVSIAYSPAVLGLLAGEAHVERVTANAGQCGDTERGVVQLAEWLSTTGGQDPRPFDVVHFNFGLHDICYRQPAPVDSREQHAATRVHGEWRTFVSNVPVHPVGWRETRLFFLDDKVNGTQSVPLERYVENLRSIVAQLQASGAALVWASTSVVPAGEAGRIAGDEVRYNAAAAAVMAEHDGVAINDLHTLTAGFGPELFIGAGDVHYTAEGSASIARQVAAHIREALRRRHQPRRMPMIAQGSHGCITEEGLRRVLLQKQAAVAAEDYTLAAGLHQLYTALHPGMQLKLEQCSPPTLQGQIDFFSRYGFCVIETVLEGAELAHVRAAWTAVMEPKHAEWEAQRSAENPTINHRYYDLGDLSTVDDCFGEPPHHAAQWNNTLFLVPSAHAVL
jgi:lysophospholipase L1-like esterase